MLAETYAYLSTVVGKALILALFLNGLLGLVARMWRPIDVPRKIVFWLSVCLLFVAGFQAWRDERAQRGHDTSLASTSPAPARHLTIEQRRVLSNTRFVSPTPGCELALTFTHTSETELYAREIGDALQQAGWPLLYSQFLNWNEKATDRYRSIAIVARPDDPTAEILATAFAQPAFKNAGIEIAYRRDTGKASCRFELQVDDNGADAHTI